MGNARDRILRYFTADSRVFPDFIVIGAMKAGTTSLFDCIGQHPQFIAPLRKLLPVYM